MISQKKELALLNRLTRKGNREDGRWIADSMLIDQDLEGLQATGTNIKALDLQGSKITDRGVHLISDLPLIELSLNDTKISDNSMQYVNKLRKLERLELEETNVTDAGIEQLKNLQHIKQLNLRSCPSLTNRSMKHIAQFFPELIHITVSNTGVDGKGIRMLTSLGELNDMGLCSLDLMDKDLDSVVKLNPKSIDLSENQITDEGLLKLKDAKRLQWIGIKYCKNSTKAGLDQLRRSFPKATIEWGEKENVSDEFKSMYEKSE